MYSPQKVALTPHEQLHSSVEQRTSFDTHACQLNIFETHQRAADFHLKFSGFTITSMLRGKKVMHLNGMEAFEYLPGQSVMALPDTLMRIDFPEAQQANPTQCTALVLDSDYLQEHLTYLNERTARPSESDEWRIDPAKIILNNNRALAEVSDKIIHLFSSSHPMKEVYIDLALKEMLLCILRIQRLEEAGDVRHSTSRAFAAVMRHIRENISAEIRLEHLCRIAGMSKSSFYNAFVHEFGITPKQLIIRERLRTAKELLLDGVNIKEVSYASGFTDPNYFIRLFKKNEGITPGELVKHALRKMM